MSYIRTHNLTKTLLALLLGLPFVLGVFSNVRPAPQTSVLQQSSDWEAAKWQNQKTETLFAHIPVKHS